MKFTSAIVLLALSTGLHAQQFDLETFEQIDPDQLRAAEDRMHEYLEPGTARLLRQPENAAERYVVARQTHLAEKLGARPQWQRLPDGTETMTLFWPAARATRVSVDEYGQPRFDCISVAERLGRSVPDFRQGNLQAGNLRADERPDR